jgi:pimeloyl-ACP methyl ester carboxylesterase
LAVGAAQAGAAPRPSPIDSAIPLIERQLWSTESTVSAPVYGAKPRFHATGPRLRLFRCDEAPGGRCGILKVRLDRAHPARGKIPIFFEYYRHRNPGPTDEAIIATLGGPGASVTQEPFFTDFMRSELFRPLLDTRDLIFLDQRGVGRSRAIDCKRLQDGVPPTGNPYADVRACGRQLGRSADLYGSDDVARDINRVRAALGIERLDLYGGSYAAVDIQAYAARFPGHLRSAVLDSPFSIPGFEPFALTVPDAAQRAVSLICARSESCSEERADAMGSVAWLAERLREEPLDGVGYDAQGNPRQVHVTEGFLLWWLLWTDLGGFVSLSEIGAAADALRDGDEVPLLRLAAEHKGRIFPNEGSPMGFSVGANLARFCTDAPLPWDKAAPIPTRRDQWADAVDDLPDDSISPFSLEGWLAPFPTGIFGPDPCIVWPAPQHEVTPPIPGDLPGDVPALILSGDIDLDTPTAEALVLADEWPNSEFVELANAGHHTAVTPRFECAHEIIERFIEQLEPGDTSCADDLDPVRYPAVGRFVVRARDAEGADVIPGSGDESTATDRRVGAVAASTATDALRRIFMENTGGRGLRGGRFSAAFGDTSISSRLRNVRFAEDVVVNGRVEYPFDTESIDAEIRVDGPGVGDGNLRVRGVWFPFLNPATVLTVRGTLGGRPVRLQVPAT